MCELLTHTCARITHQVISPISSCTTHQEKLYHITYDDGDEEGLYGCISECVNKTIERAKQFMMMSLVDIIICY